MIRKFEAEIIRGWWVVVEVMAKGDRLVILDRLDFLQAQEICRFLNSHEIASFELVSPGEH